MALLIHTNQHLSDTRQSTIKARLQPNQTLNTNEVYCKIMKLGKSLTERRGIYSTAMMKSARFYYTGNGDTVRCDACELEVSNWTEDMKPFLIHAERQPTCPNVCSIRSVKQTSAMPTTNLPQSISTLNSNERSSERLEIEDSPQNSSLCTFNEVESLKEVRQRTFSHWPHRKSPSSTQMIEAGFFNCNVGDRVICIYCNIVCQQWTTDTDDPCEVHKKLSPNCSYVITNLRNQPATSIPFVNETSTTTNHHDSNTALCDQIVSVNVCHIAYKEIPKRYASFVTWTNENSPSVDDLVRAGFYYTGAKTIVTCFYCNGSLQNWAATDNPVIEHARWFPLCPYAKQLCGDVEHRKIQQSNQRRKELQERNRTGKGSESNGGNSLGGRLNVADESTLSRYVAARLDLPVSQSMLQRNFKLSIVKRCWEDQLRLKGDDFVSDVDLFVACTILKKQIERIDGKKENIIIPKVAMNEIREKEQAASKSLLVNLSNNTDVEMSSSSSSSSETMASSTSSNSLNNKSDRMSDNSMKITKTSEDHSSPLNPCALCLTEEKCLAFVPCGHVATCVSCGHSVRSCPICRTEIKAFVRVYL